MIPLLKEIELEIKYVFPPERQSLIQNPVKNFSGIKHLEVLKRRPSNWKIKVVEPARGWIMTDEAGNERIQFMRPFPSLKGVNPFTLRMRMGYWIIRDQQGNYLDQQGKIIAPNISPVQMNNSQLLKIHIPYTGAANL